MFGQNKWLWDVVGGVGLFLALLVVFAVNRLAGPEKVVNTLDVIIVNDPNSNPEFKKMRMAVTGPERDLFTNQYVIWDNMGKMLNHLGEGYRFDSLSTTQIQQNPDILKNYDVLFLTCAPKDGAPDLKTALVDFVTRGGMLYASDWRYEMVARAFPEMVAENFKGKGTRQSVQAEVVDPNLRELIGDSIHLNFELPQWYTAAFAGPRVTTLVQGNYRKQTHDNDAVGTPAFAPLLVRFEFGQGSVIFTSFHNETQNSELETKLLQYLVFRMIMADIQSAVTEKADKEGFAAQKSNLLSTPDKEQTVTKKYDNKSGKPLRFVLGFGAGNEKAKLRLKITSPEKKVYQWEGSSLVILDVPDAPRGEWTYEVTAVELPYPNFPFSITVAEKK